MNGESLLGIPFNFNVKEGNLNMTRKKNEADETHSEKENADGTTEKSNVVNHTEAEDGALDETSAKVSADNTVDGQAAIDATATDKVDDSKIINPDADTTKQENPAVNVKTAAADAGVGVSTGPGRRNIEEYTKDYHGQLYQVLATVDGQPETSLGFTNDPTGGGLVEIADQSTNMSGPRIVKLSDADKGELTKNIYEANADARAEERKAAEANK